MYKVGFSGTREGMTDEQKKAFTDYLYENERDEIEFHHGDCVGADAQAHRIFDDGMDRVCRIVTHPSDSETFAANCDEQDNFLSIDVRVEKDYHSRNDDIIAESDEIIACPSGKEELFRGSGTWSVIRKTRKAGKKLTIIYPDGSFGR